MMSSLHLKIGGKATKKPTDKIGDGDAQCFMARPPPERRRPLVDLGNKQNTEAVVSKKVRAVPKAVQAPPKKPAVTLAKKKLPMGKDNEKEPQKASSSRAVDTRVLSVSDQFGQIDLSSDPQLVTEYTRDIYRYLRKFEEQHSINSNFLSEHHRSTPKLRQILVNWLVDIHQSFSFQLDTLHITIAILDRYLQEHEEVGKETLQLVGVTALLVASKYEEIFAPDIHDIVYVCDNQFTKKQIFDMERDILQTLNFELGRPLSIRFLRRLSQVCQATQECHSLGKYLLELCLLNYDLCHVRPSLQAAAACCLSRALLGGFSNPSQGWTRALACCSQYKFEDFGGVLIKMAIALGTIETCKERAIKKKYSGSKYDKISLNSKLRGVLARKFQTLKLIM